MLSTSTSAAAIVRPLPDPRRSYLKIKIVSLAAEARLIRAEENRWFLTADGARVSRKEQRAAAEEIPATAENRTARRLSRSWLRNGVHRTGLRTHRLCVVRPEARAALLAYGFIRGRRYRQIEATAVVPPNWKRVYELVQRYGLVMADIKARFETWSAEKPASPLRATPRRV